MQESWNRTLSRNLFPEFEKTPIQQTFEGLAKIHERVSAGKGCIGPMKKPQAIKAALSVENGISC